MKTNGHYFFFFYCFLVAVCVGRNILQLKIYNAFLRISSTFVFYANLSYKILSDYFCESVHKYFRVLRKQLHISPLWLMGQITKTEQRLVVRAFVLIYFLSIAACFLSFIVNTCKHLICVHLAPLLENRT